MIGSVLKSSLGLNLKLVEKKQEGNSRDKRESFYFYKIDAPIQIQTVFDNVIQPSPPSITPSPENFLDPMRDIG